MLATPGLILDPHLSQTHKLFRAASVAFPDARKRLVDATIRALIDAGLWDKLGLLYVLAAHDEQASRLNWKGPGASSAAVDGAPAFDADAGWSGAIVPDGPGPGLLLPDGDALPGYALDDNHQGVWVLNDATSGVAAIGHGGGGRTRLLPRSDGAMSALNAQTSTSSFGSAISTSAGYSLTTRRGAGAVEGYRNGVSLGTDSTVSTNLTGNPIMLLKINDANGNGSDLQLAIAHFGAQLTAADAENLYEIFGAYLAAVGTL